MVVKNINPATVPYLYVDQDKLQLDQKHDYFYQIQGQLLCSQRRKCYLVVYTMVDMKILEIQRDDHFINAMVLKLDAFFNNYFRGAFLRRYFHKDYLYYGYDFQPLRLLPEHIAAINGQ